MATWAGNEQEDFKEELLLQIEYLNDMFNLPWSTIFILVLEVLVYLMKNKEN